MFRPQSNTNHHDVSQQHTFTEAAAWWACHRDDDDLRLQRFIEAYAGVSLADDPGTFALLVTVRLELRRRQRDQEAA